jgi:hypothetical protein
VAERVNIADKLPRKLCGGAIEASASTATSAT